MAVMKTIKKGPRSKTEVDQVDCDVCSVHGKKRKAEYLIDDEAGGMCCAPGDECKGATDGSAGKPERKRKAKDVDPAECKWCEQGECWTHGQIEKPEKSKKPERNARRGTKDIEGAVCCSVHGKTRKEEYLIDDGVGGMCCAPGDECKDGKDRYAGKPEHTMKTKVKKTITKAVVQAKANVKASQKDAEHADRDVCSVHGKNRKAEYLTDDGAGGMCCAPGDECKGVTDGSAGKPERKRRHANVDPAECKWCEQGECWTHGQIDKPERNEGQQTKKGRGKGAKSRRPEQQVKVVYVAKGSKARGKGRR